MVLSRFCLKVSASYSLIKETPAQNKYLTKFMVNGSACTIEFILFA